jgi:hypothetical protein
VPMRLHRQAFSPAAPAGRSRSTACWPTAS